jgi:hypothetical protein
MSDFLSWLGEKSFLGWIGLIIGALGAAALVVPGELRKIRERQPPVRRP